MRRMPSVCLRVFANFWKSKEKMKMALATEIVKVNKSRKKSLKEKN